MKSFIVISLQQFANEGYDFGTQLWITTIE